MSETTRTLESVTGDDAEPAAAEERLDRALAAVEQLDTAEGRIGSLMLHCRDRVAFEAWALVLREVAERDPLRHRFERETRRERGDVYELVGLTLAGGSLTVFGPMPGDTDADEEG